MKRKRKPNNPCPPRAPGPVTDRRKANRPISGKRGGRRFVERSTLDGTLGDGPEDVSGFDADNERVDAAEFFDSRAIFQRDNE